jgi:hypothetical protein
MGRSKLRDQGADGRNLLKDFREEITNKYITSLKVKRRFIGLHYQIM